MVGAPEQETPVFCTSVLPLRHLGQGKESKTDVVPL